MALCFSCFTVKVLEDFRVMTVAREKSRLVPLKAMPTGRPTPLANAAIEIPPVITVDVIRANQFIFCNPFTNFNFIKKKCLNSSEFFKRYVCGSCGALGFKSG